MRIGDTPVEREIFSAAALIQNAGAAGLSDVELKALGSLAIWEGYSRAREDGHVTFDQLMVAKSFAAAHSPTAMERAAVVLWQQTAALQDEFGTAERYAGFVAGMLSGRVRIVGK